MEVFENIAGGMVTPVATLVAFFSGSRFTKPEQLLQDYHAVYRTKYIRQNFRPGKNCEESIQDCWKSVGDHIKWAMDEYSEENNGEIATEKTTKISSKVS
ncbi:MAG: hypothetical protein Q4D62_07985 [Planctomycetia bacterium]|nr:hypothetical protein [Planctomycetia bacterium]